MAKTPSAAAGDNSPPVVDQAVTDTPLPASLWRYVDVERVFMDLSLHVRPGDVYVGEEPPGDPTWWVKHDGPAPVIADSGYRAWEPEELAAGALREDWQAQPADVQVKETNGDA